MVQELEFFAVAPPEFEPLLIAELLALDAQALQATRGGISFRGTLETGYRACLWSRTASRILLRVAQFAVADSAELYAQILELPWEEHLSASGSLSVEFAGKIPGIEHSHYGAQRVKDAVVDRFRNRTGIRPNVQREQPDVVLYLQAHHGQATISIDLSGTSLHRRGYRVASVTAPLKETLAAALLLKCAWPELAAAGATLINPFCGSGTLAIEAAWIAADRAPNLLREYWGFNGWLGHIPALWKRILSEAQQRYKNGLERIPTILASDWDSAALRAISSNAQAAGIAQQLRIERCAWSELIAPATAPGLLIINPPYGERLGEQAEIAELYVQIGERLKAQFSGWEAALFTGNPELAKRMGLRAQKTHSFRNGTLDCRLLRFQVQPASFVQRPAPVQHIAEALPCTAAVDFAQRLQKNLRHLQRWARRENVYCYRIYDADLPEYAVAIDRYEQWFHVQEYAAPSSIDPALAAQRLQQIMAVLPQLLNVPAAHIFLKVRQRQRGQHQYQKHGQQGVFHEVREGDARFLVNFTDYLDTGLFLDHRITRQRLLKLAQQRRFLNLFGYTGSATVCAALGGASSTTTVDLSGKYLEWARRNLQLNGLQNPWRRFIQADCRAWLREAQGEYDLIFLDPPTFSNSKEMHGHLDVQRDHVELLHQALRLLARGGILVFSTNYRRFRLDATAFPEWQIEDWSAQTLPIDFARHPKIHQCYMFQAAPLPV